MSIPCVGFARIAGGAPSSARAIIAHLKNQTLALEGQKLATYYLRGMELSSDRHAILETLHPLVADGLRIDQSVPLTERQIEALAAGRRADGEKIDGKQYARERDLGRDPLTGAERHTTPVGSYVFSPEPHKSVSVAIAFAPPAEQAMIVNAHLDAARFAIGVITDGISQRRIGKGGEDGTKPGHVAALAFTHLTARRTIGADGQEIPGDPALHTHYLIPNAVFSEDGTVGSLNTNKIRGLIFEGGVAYNARLATNLRDAGFDAMLDPETNTCRMPLIPERINKLFSKQHEGIEAIAKAACAGDDDAWKSLTPEQRGAQNEIAARMRKQAGKKGDRDDIANFADWQRQAREAGWTAPRSLIGKAQRQELTHEQRIDMAYDIAMPILAKALEHKSVLSSSEIRSIAGIGFIEAGLKNGVRDFDAVTKAMWKRGVIQNGERTGLVYLDNGYEVKLTTALHEAQEIEFIDLAKKASADRSTAIPERLLDKHVKASGLDFSDAHGKAQLAMLRRLATDGKVTIGIGASGMGKSAALMPIVSALKEQGRTVYGVAVAHRQSQDLRKAGIPEPNLRALSGPIPSGSTFIEAAKAGNLDLGRQTVVIVDEIGMLGTKAALDLVRLRQQHDFTLICVGDDRQCSAIQAGPTIDLFRRALGAERVPEILTTKRQQHETEIKFASLMRQRHTKEALDLKRSTGNALMVDGGRAGVIAATVETWREWAAEGRAPLIGAPTNRDVHDIGIAIRTERRAQGQVGRDKLTFDAQGQEGHQYRLALAVGDRVRLFSRVRATFEGGSGGRFGFNGAVVEIEALDRSGMAVRDGKGQKARIAWANVTNKDGRLHLDYGDCLTIKAAQGLSNDDFILSLPGGSGATSADDAYSATTRHRLRSRIITSATAETAAIRKARPLYDERPITLDDQWGNVGKNFAHENKKDSALEMLEGFGKICRAQIIGFAQKMQPAEQRQIRGKSPSHAPEKAIRLHYGTTLRPAIQQAISLAHSLRERVGHHLSQRAPELRQRQGQGPRISM